MFQDFFGIADRRFTLLKDFYSVFWRIPEMNLHQNFSCKPLIFKTAYRNDINSVVPSICIISDSSENHQE